MTDNHHSQDHDDNSRQDNPFQEEYEEDVTCNVLMPEQSSSNRDFLWDASSKEFLDHLRTSVLYDLRAASATLGGDDDEAAANGANANAAANAPVTTKTLAHQETKAVHTLRCAVTLLVMISAAVGVSVLLYKECMKQVETSHRLLDGFHTNARLRVQAMDLFATDLSSMAQRATNQTWPWVTFADMDAREAAARTMVHSDHLGLYPYPYVTRETRAAWEEYTTRHTYQLQQAFDYKGKHGYKIESWAPDQRRHRQLGQFRQQQQQQQQHRGRNLLEITDDENQDQDENEDQDVDVDVDGADNEDNEDVIPNIDNSDDNLPSQQVSFRESVFDGPDHITTQLYRYGTDEEGISFVVDESDGPYWPVWQVSPTRVNSYVDVNYNFFYAPAFTDGLKLAHSSATAIFAGVWNVDEYVYIDDNDDYDFRTVPAFSLFYPVFDRVDVLDATQRNRFAMIDLDVEFGPLFTAVLPSNPNPLVVVVENPFHQVFSYQVNGNVAVYLGPEDWHDPKLQHMMTAALLTDFVSATLQGNCYYNGVPVNTEFRPRVISVYATQELVDAHLTNFPAYYMWAILGIFLFTCAVFILYDPIVEYRQAKVMTTAAKSEKMHYQYHQLFWILAMSQISHHPCLASQQFCGNGLDGTRGRRSLFMFRSMEDFIRNEQLRLWQEEQGHSLISTAMATSSKRKRNLKRHRRRSPASLVAAYNPYSQENDDQNDDDDTADNESSREDNAKSDREFSPSLSDQGANGKSKLKSLSSLDFNNMHNQNNHRKNRGKLWPPWPFNLLQRSPSSSNADAVSNRRGPVLRMGSFLVSFLGQHARVSHKELQDITSRLWFHLPPMTPPLILLTLIPRQEQQIIVSAETGLETLVTKTVVPLLYNPLARTLVFGGVSLAIMSWAHSELNRLRKLTPLPLNEAYRDINRAVLPHVLPDEVPEPFLVADENDDDDGDAESLSAAKTTSSMDPSKAPGSIDADPQAPSLSSSSSISQKLASSVPPRLQRHFKQFGSTTSRSTSSNGGSQQQDSFSKPKRSWGSAWKNMKRMRDARRTEAQKIQRMAIYDELVALQAIKQKAREEQKQRKASSPSNNGRNNKKSQEEPLGYALVTGASRGIGRAIAVELARYEIPLILCARDLPRLTSLAYDLEACYGIKCCVLQADLSQPHAAEQIHEATRQAGLTVDILVNNAGISSTGLSVDMSPKDVNSMIQVNGVAVAQLAHLYGKDMKERRRGRILMVSSVVGAVSAGPTVALYAATKSFEKVLGLSMAKELEPYGVGVTCLMPGAVRDTDFRSSSETHEALCWKLPGYPKSPTTVAKQGIRALLRGDVEVTPGWQNRVFVKVLKPAMPQRLHNILVEIAWTPPHFPPFLKFWKSPEKRQNEQQAQLEDRNKQRLEKDPGHTCRRISPQEWRPRSNTYLPPPLLLSVPGYTAPAPARLPESEPVPNVERIQPSLFGEEPTAESSNPIDGSQAPPSIENKDDDESVQGAIENQKEEIRKLSSPLDGVDCSDGDTSPSDPETPSAAESNNSAATEIPGQAQAGQLSQQQALQQAQQQQESERHVLQLKEQVLALQQKVQEQERKQFLQQIELERRQRELEHEKHDIEEQRKRQQEHVSNQGGEQTKEWSLRKRKNRQSSVEPTTEPDATDKPKATSLSPAPLPKKGTDRDLMTESLEHPLFAQ